MSSEDASSKARDRRRLRFYVLLALVLGVSYTVSYLALRAGRVLVHGTVIHNDTSGSHMIRGGRGAFGEHALWLFRPAAVAELHYWYWSKPFAGSPHRYYPALWIDVDECNGLGLAYRARLEGER